MNIETLEKLSQNPHYKLSAAQKRQLAEYRASLTTYGVTPLHDNSFETHETHPRKVAFTKRGKK